jgi:hypothetical protein
MEVENNIGNSGKEIQKIILSSNNFFIGRMQGIEADVISEYCNKNIVSSRMLTLLKQNTGFYCCNSENEKEILEFWINTYYDALKNCDLLFRLEFNTWDNLVKDYYNKIYVFSCASLHLWLPYLEGKRILVISPFEESIKIQFPKRHHLFTTGLNNNFKYPEFELKTLLSPNTITGNEPFPHNNWKESFEEMCNKIINIEFDIAILGCGSYGMPLAHHIKKIGKSSIYTGAYAQVMFGIKGKRWDISGNPHRSYWNEYWKWPEDTEVPKNSNKVEGGCYWK